LVIETNVGRERKDQTGLRQVSIKLKTKKEGRASGRTKFQRGPKEAQEGGLGKNIQGLMDLKQDDAQRKRKEKTAQ